MDPTFLSQLAGIAQQLEAGLQAELMSFGVMLSGATSQAAFQTAFRGIWPIALNRARDINLLRLLQPMLRPGLGFVGATWARIELATLAFTGATMSEILLGVLAAIVVIAVAILLILLAIWLFQKLRDAMGWVPAQQNPQPMQTPHWNNLLNSLNAAPYGPVYALNQGAVPNVG